MSTSDIYLGRQSFKPQDYVGRLVNNDKKKGHGLYLLWCKWQYFQQTSYNWLQLPYKLQELNLDTESEHESDDDIQIAPEKVELSKKQKQSQFTDFFRS